MIHTSTQLKALVRNQSGGDSNKAVLLFRSYFMERFLERLSLSSHRNQFILKGGLLISSMIGLNKRSTMDADVTIRGFSLNEDETKKIIADILAVDLDDGVTFSIQSVGTIRDEADYPGIRIMFQVSLDKMVTPMKLDISTGDTITPREIEYDYPLMFEDRSISILAYNLETSLAEKLESILTRGTANTRLRDFYDIHILTSDDISRVNYDIMAEAFKNTTSVRGTSHVASKGNDTLQTIREDSEMEMLWENYQSKFDYAKTFSWDDVIDSVDRLYKKISM